MSVESTLDCLRPARANGKRSFRIKEVALRLLPSSHLNCAFNPCRAAAKKFSLASSNFKRVAMSPYSSRQCDHQSNKESGVCHLILHGWSGWQRAILDPQMGNAIRNAIARAVPAPHRAIVHSQG